MFPWLPFVVFPDPTPTTNERRHRRRQRRTLQEEMLVVHTTTTSTATFKNNISTERKRNQRQDEPQMEIVCELAPLAAMKFNKCQFKTTLDVVEMPLPNQQEELPLVAEEQSLLPKAPTEHIKVEFREDEQQQSTSATATADSTTIIVTNRDDVDSAVLMAPDANAIIEKLVLLPKSARCSTTASTSSSSGQLTVRPPSSSSRRKVGPGTTNGGSRSGSSSAKQSPRSIHRSSDSIVSITKKQQIDNKVMVTPSPKIRRRRSAFETSQAMRELFGGSYANESPFSCVREKKTTMQRPGHKENENIDLKTKGTVTKIQNEEVRTSTHRQQQHLTDESGPPQQDVDGAAASSISEVASTAKIPSKSFADAKLNVTQQLEQQQKAININGGGNDYVEEWRKHNSIESGTNRFEQSEVSRATLAVQRNANRQKNIARVAPFAYFPAEEHQQIEQTNLRQQRSTQKAFESDNEVLKPSSKESTANFIPETAQKSTKFDDKNRQRISTETEAAGRDNYRRPLINGTREQQPPAKLLDGHFLRSHIVGQTTIAVDNQLNLLQSTTTLPGNLAQLEHKQKQQTEQISSSPRNSSFGGAKTTGKEFAIGSVPTQSGKDDSSGQKGRTTQQRDIFTSGGAGGGGGSTGAPSIPVEMVQENKNGVASMGNGGVEQQFIIRNARIINDDDIFVADVLIEGGIIKKISQESIELTAEQNYEEFDANGKCMLPAGIDFPTELLGNTNQGNMLTLGTKAAICGGTGTIVEILNMNPAETIDNGISVILERCKAMIDANAECNVALSVSVNRWRGEQSRQEMTRFSELGVNCFILNLFDDMELFEALEHARKIGALCQLTPENAQMLALIERGLQNQYISNCAQTPGSIQNEMQAKIEAQRVHQIASLALLANTPVAIKAVSTLAVVRSVKDICHSEQFVAAEVPIAAVMGLLQFHRAETKDSVLELLACHRNSLCVSEQRQQTTNQLNPIALIQQRMSSLWEHAVIGARMDPMRFVATTSSNPARLLNLYPRKGRIAVGSDADLVLWDLHTTDNNNHGANSTNSHNQQMINGTTTVCPVFIMLGGRVRFHNGQFVSITGDLSKREGHMNPTMFLPIEPNSHHLFGIHRLRACNYNFPGFVNNRRQQQQRAEMNAEQSPTKTESRQSTRTGTPEEPTISLVTTAQTASVPRPSSRNRNALTDQPQSRAATKVIHPPGGKSSTFW